VSRRVSLVRAVEDGAGGGGATMMAMAEAEAAAWAGRDASARGPAGSAALVRSDGAIGGGVGARRIFSRAAV